MRKREKFAYGAQKSTDYRYVDYYIWHLKAPNSPAYDLSEHRKNWSKVRSHLKLF